MPTWDSRIVELNYSRRVVKESIASMLIDIDPWCQFTPIRHSSVQGPVLSYFMIDIAAAAGRCTAPTFSRTAASIDVHVVACAAVAHLRTRDVMVTDRVVHPPSTIRSQIVFLVSAAHRNIRKARQPKQTVKEHMSRAW
jgi:hypothetical protein